MQLRLDLRILVQAVRFFHPSIHEGYDPQVVGRCGVAFPGVEQAQHERLHPLAPCGLRQGGVARSREADGGEGQQANREQHRACGHQHGNPVAPQKLRRAIADGVVTGHQGAPVLEAIEVVQHRIDGAVSPLAIGMHGRGAHDVEVSPRRAGRLRCPPGAPRRDRRRQRNPW